MVLDGELGDGGEFDSDDFEEVLAETENELILRNFVMLMGAVSFGPSEPVFAVTFSSVPFAQFSTSVECCRWNLLRMKEPTRFPRPGFDGDCASVGEAFFPFMLVRIAVGGVGECCGGCDGGGCSVVDSSPRMSD
jgi:hypothetical protein